MISVELDFHKTKKLVVNCCGLRLNRLIHIPFNPLYQ